jgi:hypothetical protein
MFDGRFALKDTVGNRQSAVPSAFTCSVVLPKARASACAKSFTRSMS